MAKSNQSITGAVDDSRRDPHQCIRCGLGVVDGQHVVDEGDHADLPEWCVEEVGDHEPELPPPQSPPTPSLACCATHARGERTSDGKTWCWRAPATIVLPTLTGSIQIPLQPATPLEQPPTIDLCAQIWATATHWRDKMEEQLAQRNPSEPTKK